MGVRVPKTAGCFALSVTLLVGLIGCAGATRPADWEGEAWAERGLLPESHLIFDPRPTGWEEVDFPRNDWPGTVSSGPVREEVAYDVTILDFQGLSPRNPEREYYRRFSSVRRGRTTR
ncbi:MAG: hypothetical protein D6788_10945 [Planctomycetota bacterium]|nr:MAG: hypothetical protein D6788_10945 [Planctomycetota bacterium]